MLTLSKLLNWPNLAYIFLVCISSAIVLSMLTLLKIHPTEGVLSSAPQSLGVSGRGSGRLRAVVSEVLAAPGHLGLFRAREGVFGELHCI